MALVLCSLLCSAVVLLIILMQCFHCPTVRASVCVCVRARPKVWLPQKKKQSEMDKNEEELAPRFAWFAFAVASLCLAVVRLSPAVACAITFAAAHCLLWVTLSSLLPALSFCLSLSHCLSVAVAAFWVMSISRAAGNIICPGSPAGIHFNSVQRLLPPLLLPSTHPHP